MKYPILAALLVACLGYFGWLYYENEKKVEETKIRLAESKERIRYISSPEEKRKSLERHVVGEYEGRLVSKKEHIELADNHDFILERSRIGTWEVEDHKVVVTPSNGRPKFEYVLLPGDGLVLSYGGGSVEYQRVNAENGGANQNKLQTILQEKR
jgi:hypothetical protein